MSTRCAHFDHPEFASTQRDQLRDRAASLASEEGIEIEQIAKSHTRNEAAVAKVLEQRGEHPGLVPVMVAMVSCAAYGARHDRQTLKT